MAEESDFLLLQGQVLGLQCSLGGLIGALAVQVPALREALIQARDASDHLVDVIAAKAGPVAPRELTGAALDVVEQLWAPVSRPN